MKYEVKIVLHPDKHKSQTGKLFEDLIRSILEGQGYNISQNVNFTGLEVDLIAEHKDRKNDLVYVECKAKEKVLSEEIKKFSFNLNHKNVPNGYFIYTEELDHQANGLHQEMKTDGKYNNHHFFGPEKVIELLTRGNFIQPLDMVKLNTIDANVHKICLLYAYFGIYYIILPFNNTIIDKYYVINAKAINDRIDIEKAAETGESIKVLITNTIKECKNATYIEFPDMSGTKIPIKVISKQSCDLPPATNRWVGRKKEILSISSSYKTIFITGIGGQGKSSLAAYYISNNINNNEKENFEFWDWRDCKEEENRFYTQMIVILERLTKGKTTSSQLKDFRIEDIIDLFFTELGTRKILFVFDNVDQYIDYQTLKPVKGVGYLLEKTLSIEHNAKFLFTCRPFIKYARPDFYQLNLSGLTLEDTIELFKKYNIPIKPDELLDLIKNIHAITNGHPMWLNLIAAQAERGKKILNDFIENIRRKSSFDEDDFSYILSENILNTVWNTLNENQKTVLQAMSELLKPVSDDILETMVESEVSFMDLMKSLKVLKSLNLVVIKQDLDNQELFELHPLVKEYLKNKYNKDRYKYITMVTRYYDKMIIIFKPKLSFKATISIFQYWTEKIELEINKKNFELALELLNEIQSPILAAGYSEEFIRIAKILFDTIDWKKAIDLEYENFLDTIEKYHSSLLQFGNFEESLHYLTKLKRLISERDANFIKFCQMQCNHFWFTSEYVDAIKIGEKAWELLSLDNPQKPIPFHVLPLAWRDSKNKKYIEKALSYFMQGRTLEQYLTDSLDIEISSDSYGNVGRCLEFLNKPTDALTCYFKSFHLLSKAEHSDRLLNLGYASYWIAGILVEQRLFEEASFFTAFGICNWSKASPYRCMLLITLKEKILNEKKDLSEMFSKEEWELEKFCKNFMTKAMPPMSI